MGLTKVNVCTLNLLARIRFRAVGAVRRAKGVWWEITTMLHPVERKGMRLPDEKKLLAPLVKNNPHSCA